MLTSGQSRRCLSASHLRAPSRSTNCFPQPPNGDQPYMTVGKRSRSKMRVATIEQSSIVYDHDKEDFILRSLSYSKEKDVSWVGKQLKSVKVTSFIGGGTGQDFTFKVGDKVWFRSRESGAGSLSRLLPPAHTKPFNPGQGKQKADMDYVDTFCIDSMVYWRTWRTMPSLIGKANDPVVQNIKVWSADRASGVNIWELLPDSLARPGSNLTTTTSTAPVGPSTASGGSSASGSTSQSASAASAPVAYRPGARKRSAASFAPDAAAAAATTQDEAIVGKPKVKKRGGAKGTSATPLKKAASPPKKQR